MKFIRAVRVCNVIRVTNQSNVDDVPTYDIAPPNIATYVHPSEVYSYE